ncbi:hypothetical protein TNCV_3005951 [Trichonephila clavipes]|nr:hypothetical protein TNCV_3005951 [Trichonephila clavipes]
MSLTQCPIAHIVQMKHHEIDDLGEVPSSPETYQIHKGSCQWYWARNRDKASHGPIPIPLGYRGHDGAVEIVCVNRNHSSSYRIKRFCKTSCTGLAASYL